MFKRKPDMIIGDNYMHRWYIIPRNRFFNVYLHKIMADDDDQALHDHPWWSLSFRLKGVLREHYQKDRKRVIRLSPRVTFRSSTFAHRLEVVKSPVLTLFITGPKIRTWGFHCPRGWVPWFDFVDSRDNGQVGRGCGED